MNPDQTAPSQVKIIYFSGTQCIQQENQGDLYKVTYFSMEQSYLGPYNIVCKIGILRS